MASWPGEGGAENANEVGADVIGILDTVDLPIIVVGRDCKVVRFNRIATAALHLTPSGIGQSLCDVLPKVEGLEALCAQVIADEVPCRRDIRDGDRWFVLRIAPYTAGAPGIAGAVLTFTNVTGFRASIDQAIYEREYTKAILNTVIEPLVVLDADLRVQTANRAFYEIFSVSRDQTQGVPLSALWNDELKTSGLPAALKAALSESPFETVEVELDFPAVGPRTVLVGARRLSREGDALLLVVFQDITERKQSEIFLQLQKECLEGVVRGLPLREALDAVVRAMGSQSPATTLTAIHLLNEEGTHFSDCIAPGLPESYHRAINGMSIDSKSDPCCLAVLTGEIVTIHDLTVDNESNAQWSAFARFAAPLGIRSAWATTIVSSAGRIIGTFANYHTQPRTPDPKDFRVAGILTRTVALAIERKQSENAMRQRTAQFETLLNHAPVGVYLVDSELRIQQVNPVALPRFEDIPNLVGRDFNEVMHILRPKESADAVVKIFRHTLETGESYFIAEDVTTGLQSGVTEFYEWQTNRIQQPDGRHGVVCYFRDISRQISAREAIRKSEERLRFMAESMPQKIFTAKPTGDVDYFNRQWMDFTGLSFEQIKDWGWTQFIHPEDVEENVRLWRHSVETGEPFQFFHRFRRADGAYRWHLSRAHAMLDSDGNISMWIGSNTDIHDQREAEEQVRQAQKLESLGVLAGGIAHDFNNLLVGMLGNASMALDILTPAHPVAPILNDVIGASERAAALTRQMLAYSGKGKFLITLMDVSELVGGLTNLLRSSISRTVDLKLHLAKDLPPIEADESQIQQLIMNLVINGAEAIEKSGSVTVRTYQLDLGAEALRALQANGDVAPGKYVCVEVADTGSGIDGATKAKMFDPFFTTKFAGRGLGLAAVSGIMRGHKGFIRVDSDLGKGATLRVLLPAAVASKASQKTAALLPIEGVSGSETILVVDDERIVRNFVKFSLERHGYSLLFAENGRQAVEIFQKCADRISLVLLDMTMPVMSGEETLDHLKAIRPGVRVVLSSGFSEVEAARRFQGQGLAGFLQKPYTAANLARQVKETIEHARPALS